VKSPAQLVDDVDRRLARTWASHLAGDSPAAPEQETPSEAAAWPHAFPLGQPSSAELGGGFAAVANAVRQWRTWASAQQVELRLRTRRVMSTEQDLPTHVVVPDVDTAARLCGREWLDRVARGRRRAAVLAQQYPHLQQPARVLAAVDALSDIDFDLLCRAADWFATHDATGLTPRQVPVEGLHAKWLNTRHALVRELAALDDLRLLPPHPARVHFTYLDPDYRAAGGRLHDSATVGDRVTLPYRPTVVVISENKDTAIGFPELPGAVSVEGVGRGGGTAAAFAWIRDASTVFYWGDMDADGLEILNEFRAAGIPATSILMDLDAYAGWERYGVNHDPKGRPLEPRKPRPTPHLTDSEAALYERLIAADWDRPRRIEQERIPLHVAAAMVERHLRMAVGTPVDEGTDWLDDDAAFHG
jgi:hypothetical protein